MNKAKMCFLWLPGWKTTKERCWSNVFWNRRWDLRNWGGRKLPRVRLWREFKHSFWLVCFLSSRLLRRNRSITWLTGCCVIFSKDPLFLYLLGGRRKLHKGVGSPCSGFCASFGTRRKLWGGQHRSALSLLTAGTCPCQCAQSFFVSRFCR